MNRRDLILAGACVGAAGLAFQLKPHRHLRVAKDVKLASIVPLTFGGWSAADAEDGGVLKPETEGTLAARLYSEIIAREYRNAATGEQVMMLIAYGDTQSDLLQLHRPEVCYPAVGFDLISAATANLMVTPGADLPVRRVVARKLDREESIVYWARLGEYLPTTSAEQRKVRLLTAMQGYIPDGGLFRFSTITADPATSFVLLDRFLKEFMLAVAPSQRAALVGTKLAGAMSGRRQA